MLRASNKRLRLGQQISYETFNSDWPEHVGSTRERIISLASDECGLKHFLLGVGAPGNETWPGANDVVAIPFRVYKGMTVYQLGWMNGGGTLSDSCDIGIYDASWNRKVSAGSTARSGVSSMQWADVTDTFLRVGSYYLAMSNSGATAANHRGFPTSTAVVMASLGLFDSTTAAFPLPDPLTNMAAAATFTQVPTMFIAARIPF